MPRRLISDNGVQFISAIMQKVAYCLGIQQTFTPVYRPESNHVERKNRDLKAQLAILVKNKHNTWSQNLSAIRFSMNTSKCQSTGYTAAYLTFGRELRTADDVEHDLRTIVESENLFPQITPYLRSLANTLKLAREAEQQMQDRNKKYCDQRRRTQPDLKVCSKVLVTTHVLSNATKGITSKFVPKRDGPYIITNKKGSSSFEIAKGNEPNVPLGTYHVSALTPYRGLQHDDPPIPVNPLRRRGRPKMTTASQTNAGLDDNISATPDAPSGRLLRKRGRL